MPGENADAVTVVVTCFNYGRYLADAIASVRSQEGGAPSVVVVDDGSTDPETREVVAGLREDGDLRLVEQGNAGVATARNAGLQLVRTPLVMMLDADDLLPSSATVTLRRALQERPDVGYAYGFYEFFDGAAGVLRFPPFDPWRIMFRHIVGATALVRREVLQDIGGYDPAFRYEDWELWVHALARGHVGLQVDVRGLWNRRHGHSKFTGDRVDYHAEYAALRAKHQVLYGDLAAVARRSSLGPLQRALYRRLWGPRPWPAGLESALHARLWRRRDDAPAPG